MAKAMNLAETRKWLAGELRKLADAVEHQRVLSFSVDMPAELVEVDPEDGDEFTRRAFTGVKGLYVTYTEHPLADGRVQPFHESQISTRDPGIGETS